MIEELKGKESKNFEQDKHRLYRFVSRPGPLNFLEEEEAKDVPGTSQQDDSLCIANSFALRTGTCNCPLQSAVSVVKIRYWKLL